MHACICYFLLDVRANQCGCAWDPWSTDSFETYSNFVYFTCLLSPHLCMYLLFSFGCSGEPVRPFVSSLKYRFLWKIEYLPILYIRNIISYYACICYFLLDVRANQCGCAWVPWSIDSYRIPWHENHLICACICYFLLDVRANQYFTLKYRFLRYSNYHLIYACICYFLMDVRANQSGHSWVPWSIDSFEK